jgi:pyridoxine 5-phosphate synthase
MLLLGVNIDHVATLRQARYRGKDGATISAEPDPIQAAFEAELGGADIITVHLREDRRHIQDRDLALLRKTCRARINLEMAATDELVGIALEHQVHMVTLVPEARQEITTEGGLNVSAQHTRLAEIVKRLKGAGIRVSAFIDATSPQIQAAKQAGFDVCEVHTGPYAHAFAAAGGDFRNAGLAAELGQIAIAGGEIHSAGMRFNAGHALNYLNVPRIAQLPGISELHIGHALVSRAVFVGLRQAVRDMKDLMLAACSPRP